MKKSLSIESKSKANTIKTLKQVLNMPILDNNQKFMINKTIEIIENIKG